MDIKLAKNDKHYIAVHNHPTGRVKKNLKYVPTYLVVEQIRKEEKRIAKEKLVIKKTKLR